VAEEALKKCSKCKALKSRKDFYVRKASPDGLSPICKICRSVEGKEWYYKNKDKAKKSAEKWRSENIGKVLEKNKKWRDKHPEKYKESINNWRARNTKRTKETNKAWYEENSGRVKENGKKWAANNIERARATRRKASAKIRSTPRGKINNCLVVAINKSLKGSKSYRKSFDLVGFTLEELMAHLEKKFKDGMSWENQGSYWHIDHKIPISAFNFQTPDDIDFKNCWALGNLQPLKAIDNRTKKDKLMSPFQPSLLLKEAVNGR